MKINGSVFAITLTAFSLLMSSALHAKGGSGVRGGGHVTDAYGTPRLADLVTKSVCDWKSGTEMLASHPELSQVLTHVAKLDWYFAFELKREIEFLQFCLTGPIYQPNLYPWSDYYVVRPPKELKYLAGFRWDTEVYLDADLLGSLPAKDQAFLILHETLHSYLSMDLNPSQRALYLRSMVKSLSKVDQGLITTRAELHRQIKGNQIDFPLTVSSLTPYQSQVKFLLGSMDDRVLALKSSQNPEEFLLQNFDPVAPYLARWDWVTVQSFTPVNLFEVAIAQLVKDGDLASTLDLLGKNFSKVNPALAAASVLNELTDEQIQAITQSRYFTLVFKDIYRKLTAINLQYLESRIMAPIPLQALTYLGARQQWVPMTSLSPEVTRDGPLFLRSLSQLIALLIEHQRWEEVSKHVAENPEFYRALGLVEQKNQIAKMTLEVPREQQVAVVWLGELSQSLLDVLMSNVKKELAAKFSQKEAEIAYQKLEAMIRLEKSE